MVDLLDRIKVMLKQESRCYTTQDYLAPSFQSDLSSLKLDDDGSFLPLQSTAATVSSSSTSSSSSGITEVWREKICEWSYQVIDHFDFSREVVSVATNYLDRYLSTRTVNKKVFQLAAMTSLYIAIKLHEPGRLSMSSMIELSRGFFTAAQMVAMEMSILRSVVVVVV
jgi:protoheme ferro-lyase